MQDSHKKAQKSQKETDYGVSSVNAFFFCDFCAFLWLVLTSSKCRPTLT